MSHYVRRQSYLAARLMKRIPWKGFDIQENVEDRRTTRYAHLELEHLKEATNKVAQVFG